MARYSVEKRVQKGAEKLDSVLPGWAKKVVMNRLDVGSDIDCVLGQIFGEFSHGVTQLFGAREVHPENFGFDTNYIFDGGVDDFDQLKKEWVKTIRARRAV